MKAVDNKVVKEEDKAEETIDVEIEDDFMAGFDSDEDTQTDTK